MAMPTASVSDRELNTNAGSRTGAFLIPDLAAGHLVRGFTATFKVRMISGNGNADGFSFRSGIEYERRKSNRRVSHPRFGGGPPRSRFYGDFQSADDFWEWQCRRLQFQIGN